MSKLLKIVLFEGVLWTVLPDGSFLPKEVKTVITSDCDDPKGMATAEVTFIVDISKLGNNTFTIEGTKLESLIKNEFIKKQDKCI